MTDSTTTDLDAVLSRLDDLHGDLTETQQAMLSAIVAKAAAGPADDEVAGFQIRTDVMLGDGSVKPSAFKPTLKGLLNGWGQDVI